ncbi:MAG: hypothetical protein OEY87_03630 [Gammaproteobacteria bacterium]|nr:hypothetical protein [Gammaproteobacteria bacterium]MDH5735194.1 hypothetical protein [Gammaproteobacteria bacterium]
MKIKISRAASLFLLFLITGNSHADALFWGISVINQEINLTVNDGTNSTTATDDGSGFGIYADSYYQNKYRLNGTLSYVDYTSFNITSATASADYLIPVNAQATFFMGATAGGAGQVYSGSGVSDSAFAALYGLQTGAIMLLGNSVMLELGYRLRYTNLETEFTGTTITSTIDELNETYLSLTILM